MDTIICATDAGREGELIFRLVYEKLGCIKPIQRLWISSLEEETIASGFSDLHDGRDFEHLYQAALCRAKADWIVGINATRLFSVLYGQTLNIGRVMSPTLAMIVERNDTIMRFQSEPFYKVQLECGKLLLLSEKLENKEEAEKLMRNCNNQEITILKVEKKERTEKPPKLYDLTTLQREANQILGFTAQQTLQYAQSLYEKKLITYPRTDSRFLTEDMERNISYLVDISAACIASNATGSGKHIDTLCSNKKVKDHHAIIPTVQIKEYDIYALSYGEREIFKLIALRLVVATSENHIFSETAITAKCSGYFFATKGKVIIKQGWRGVSEEYHKKDEKEEQPLPDVQIGDTYQVISRIQEGKTVPPKEHTDATLLSAMENANNALEDAERKGIGTPATRAGILEKLVNAELIERVGKGKVKNLVPTRKGIALVSTLPEILKSPKQTAEWENKLKQIEEGKLSGNLFLQEINELMQNIVKTYEAIGDGFPDHTPKQMMGMAEEVGKCPRCGEGVVEKEKGFFCFGKQCGFVIWRQNKFFTSKKVEVTRKLVKELLKDKKVYLKGCYSPKTGKTYNGTAVLDDTGGQYVNFKMVFGKK